MRKGVVLATVFLLMLFVPLANAGGTHTVYVAKIDGMITGYTVDQFSRYISAAENAHAEALIIELNTPGGLGDAMMKIVSEIQNSTVPVIIYVAPRGAIAASAGTYIAMGSHIIVMAPGTSIGACEPIMGYAANGSIIKAPAKIRNFYTAYMRSLAQESGRNETAAVEFITKDLSLTPEEALKAHVVEAVAGDVPDLLRKVNGMETRIPVAGRGNVTLNLEGARVVYLGQSFKDTLINYITDPTVAYLLLNLGILGLVLGFLTPGWHVPETVGAILLVLGLIGLGYFGYSSSGLLLIVLAMVFFIAEALTPTFGLFTVAGVVTFIMGGILLFGGGGEYLVSGNVYENLRIVIVALALLIGLFFAFGMAAVVRAHRKKPEAGREELIGKRGRVVQDIAPEGMIRVHGELWRAVSKDGNPIKVGEDVVVVEIRGLTLIVSKEGKGNGRT